MKKENRQLRVGLSGQQVPKRPNFFLSFIFLSPIFLSYLLICEEFGKHQDEGVTETWMTEK